MILRELLLSDFYKGYFSLLKQLSVVNYDTFNDFKPTWYKYAQNNHHFIYVIEDNNKIIGSGTIILEPKFIRDGTFVGHIEDIVIDENYRNKKLSSMIVKKLKQVGFEHNCHRITLNCTEYNSKYYLTRGFKKSTLCMRIDKRDF